MVYTLRTLGMFSNRGRYRSFKRFGPDHIDGKHVEHGLGLPPGGCGQAHLLRTEPVEELFARPAGFLGDLGEEAAAAVTDGEINAFGEGLEIEGAFDGPGWREHAHFDGEPGEFFGGDGGVGEARVFEHAARGGFECDDERLGRVDAADAPAEAVAVQGMQGDEAAGGVAEAGIGRLGDGIVDAKGAADIGAGEVEDFFLERPGHGHS
jgi:hypothetical protein